MARPRPSSVNFAQSEIKAQTAAELKQSLIDRGVDADIVEKLIESANKPSTKFGEHNLQVGDILYFPNSSEFAVNATDFVVDRTEWNPAGVGVAMTVTVKTESGGERNFNISSLVQSGTTVAGDIMSSKCPEKIINSYKHLATKEEQYAALSEFMQGKALLVKDMKRAEVVMDIRGTIVRQRRTFYTYELLED